jgi:hypothetical protein
MTLHLCLRPFFPALLVACNLPAQEARESVTEQVLRQQAAAVPALKTRLEAIARPAPAEPPAIQHSLWSRSHILFDGEKFTVIPIGSILHLPPALRDRIVEQPQGEFTFWPNFLKRNSAWLAAREVPLELARGDQAALKSMERSLAADPRLHVAVHRGGPITLLEPASKEPERR